ncbi:hypothetical protein, partial [Providencia stuartii]|uniref:hypothetical protein n=1 Tax=Providencia stuartii TaxID=588 RepID=UPI001EF82A59
LSLSSIALAMGSGEPYVWSSVIDARQEGHEDQVPAAALHVHTDGPGQPERRHSDEGPELARVSD